MNALNDINLYSLIQATSYFLSNLFGIVEFELSKLVQGKIMTFSSKSLNVAEAEINNYSDIV